MIRADLHTHTNHSHARDSVRQMFEAGREKGLLVQGFSEHSPRPGGYDYPSEYRDHLAATFDAYLAEVEVASLEEALERLLRGDYTVEERMMLSGSVRRGDGSRETAQLDALNDVTVTRCGPMQVVPLRIWVNGQLLAGYGADGIVIATPTGSTGYNLSAGGPIVEPEAGLILLTPICPHTLNTRSVVLCDRDEVEVEIGRKPSGDVQEVEVSFDGALLTRLRSGDRVRVKKSERTTSIIRLSEPAFLERLHRKMSE